MMNHKHPLELISVSADVNHSKIDASIIWLHGLGADGYDSEPIAQRLLNLSTFAHVRFILPHAPEMPVTRNNGHIMPAWYDVYGSIPITKEDEAGVAASQTYINTLIKKEINRGIPSNRIVLAGFSQGGAVALYTALHYPEKLAAVVSLSTYLPLQSQFNSAANRVSASMPIFMAHGLFDDIIPLDLARASFNTLQNCRYLATWHEYPMAHQVSEQEIIDITQFLQQVLALDLVE
ncbi:MAG: alpha/beta fold hydrolase [Methylotenera sp.]|nr:alpha/beta fold hydrolase [Methylotenera sp.]